MKFNAKNTQIHYSVTNWTGNGFIPSELFKCALHLEKSRYDVPFIGQDTFFISFWEIQTSLMYLNFWSNINEESIHSLNDR